IRHNSWEQVLVFTRTKHGANRLAEKLEKDGIAAAAIHGNKSQSARTRALAQFKKGEVPVLVATDIAARGLDIEELPHVVNFELPMVAEDYIHRIGRTGRAGTSGAAVSLVDPEEVQLLRAIEKLIKRPIERVAVEGFIAPKVDRAERELEKRQDNQRPAHHVRSPRERQPERQHRGRSVEQPRRGQRGVQQPNAIDGSRVARVRDAEARANRVPNDRDDDSRGNQIHANVSDNAQRHPTRSFSHNDSSRKPAGRRDEPRNRPHRNENDDNRGNRVHDERATTANSNRALPADDSTEAARHQAMPQPALFSPRPQQRRRG
ncbi:MAG TPA: helicase-related protein, partial [Burkholderiales bacterium]|nr:helicase-related protein [Burkholderiales bacterium]